MSLKKSTHILIEGEYFWNNRIVSKLVASISYKTRYEAVKIERICVLHSRIGDEPELPKRKVFGTIVCTVSSLPIVFKDAEELAHLVFPQHN